VQGTGPGRLDACLDLFDQRLAFVEETMPVVSTVANLAPRLSTYLFLRLTNSDEDIREEEQEPAFFGSTRCFTFLSGLALLVSQRAMSNE
jgi:hypothetical protein